MKSEQDIRDALVQAHNDGRLVTCRVPYGGDLAIALERHMVDQAMTEWNGKPEPARRSAMVSVLKEIKRVVKRMKQQKATGADMDGLAADVALWLGHELMFADGERHLIKGPELGELKNP